MRTTILFALLAVLLSGCGYWVSTTGDEVPIDTNAPSFELTNQHGEQVSLAELREDGPVVVEFYRGEFCGMAKGRVKRIEKNLAPDLEARDVSVVAISTDDPDTVRQMAAEHDIEFPLLSDPNAEVVDAYGVMMEGDWEGRKIAVPSTFVISPNGEVTFAHVGDTAGDFAKPKKIARAVDAAGQTNTATARTH